ncbi:hypothetical protein R6242_18820 [Iodobacter sp. CM08]|uniref:hypothetical protein n=1 Tax=Iodobacter sp. CM08 TaxID=3085902 RepID=UPI0029827F71|nr:hypothetical protein [Iodobacter sp. CM08]MDW5418622.1 hypothetical protein [Iodobacter sp. CM08]
MLIGIALIANDSKRTASIYLSNDDFVSNISIYDIPIVNADYIWTNLTEAELWSEKLGSYQHIKPNDWMPTELSVLLDELSAYGQDASKKTALVVSRALEAIKIALPRIEFLTSQISNDISNYVMPQLAFDFSEIGSKSFNKSIIMDAGSDAFVYEVRPNRAAHARTVLSIACNTENWIRISEPSLEMAISTISISSCSLTSIAASSFIKNIYSFGAGNFTRQTMLSSLEILMALARYRITVNETWIPVQPRLHPCAEVLAHAGHFTFSSLSLGLAHECFLAAAGSCVTHGKTPPSNAIIAASDRAYLMPSVIKLAVIGAEITGYGSGKITIKCDAKTKVAVQEFTKKNGMTIARKRSRLQYKGKESELIYLSS